MAAGCGSNAPENISISGELITSGNGPIPPHASAHVSLVQHGSGSGENRIVAERSLHDLGKKPIRFDISVGRSLVDEGGHYGLSAQILDSNGNIRWATPVAQAITPLESDETHVTLMLQATGVRVQDAFKRFRCADDFKFAGDMSRTRAILRLGMRRVAVDADTDAPLTAIKHYSDAHGNQLDLKGGTATLNLDGHRHKACVEVTENEARPRPDGAQTSSGQGQGGPNAGGNTPDRAGPGDATRPDATAQ